MEEKGSVHFKVRSNSQHNNLKEQNSQSISRNQQNSQKRNASQFQSIDEIVLPSTLNEKTCSFGYDVKKFIPPHVLRNAKENPSPGNYDMLDVFELNKLRKRGSSFGFRRETQSKLSQNVENFAKYEVVQEIGKDKHKYKFYQNDRQFLSNYSKDKIGYLYDPKFDIVENERFRKISFGIGDRKFNDLAYIPVKTEFNQNLPNFTQVQKSFRQISFGKGERSNVGYKQEGPGPIYRLPSFTDKFIKLSNKAKA